MELRIDEQGQEQKRHGTYGFPVYLDRKWLSSYVTGGFPWHWHREIELTLVLEGAMEYRVNDSRYHLQAGEGLFCNSNALHAGSQLPGQDCDYLSLTFHPRLLRGFEGSVLGPKYVDALVNSPGLSSARLTPAVDWQARILRELAAILRLSREKGELYELEVLRGLLEIWAQLYQGFGEAARQDTGEDPEKLRRLRAILTFLHQHYREKVTLEEVARQVGLCKSECCRFFKRQMGVPLFDYLLDYRVGKSLELLQSGCTVAESGAQSGFSTPAYFSKVFRARTGRSPSEYRRENRGED